MFGYQGAVGIVCWPLCFEMATGQLSVINTLVKKKCFWLLQIHLGFFLFLFLFFSFFLFFAAKRLTSARDLEQAQQWKAVWPIASANVGSRCVKCRQTLITQTRSPGALTESEGTEKEKKATKWASTYRRKTRPNCGGEKMEWRRQTDR